MTALATLTEEIFFQAMNDGYAQNRKPQTHPTIDGWKILEFKYGKWHLLDQWGEQGGSTIIQYDRRVIWVMKYFGSYPDDVIPLLKAALADRYQVVSFCGGRGQKVFRNSNSSDVYHNEWKGDFSNFSGHEAISREITREYGGSFISTVGSHEYWGGMLI